LKQRKRRKERSNKIVLFIGTLIISYRYILP